MTADAQGGQGAALKRVIATSRRFFVFVGLFSFFISLLMLVAPLYMLQIYDRVLTSGSMATLVFLTLAAAGLILTSALLELFRSRILVRLSGHLDRQLRDPVFNGLLHFGLRHQGSGLSQPLRDLDTVRSFLSSTSLVYLFDAPWVVVFLGVIFLMHWVLGTFATVGALILFGIAWATELTTRKRLAEASRNHLKAFNFAESSFRNAEVIEAMGMLSGLRKRWSEGNGKALHLQAKVSDQAANLRSTAKFIRPVLQVGILGTGAALVLAQEITAGMMIAASIIMGRALAPVEGAIGQWRSFANALSAYSRLQQFMSSLPEDGERLPLPPPKGAVSVENVVAVPPGLRKPVLKGVSLKIGPGDALGIIGPSAAGKSSLARLLVGVWRPAAGSVRLDGANVCDWDHELLGVHLGYLPQDVELFQGTIAENIARFREPDPEAVVRAARLAGVHDLILHLEKGYDTQIGEGGVGLSGGQRQRIGLARALYGDPALVVLDEPNSNLDNDGENALWQALQKLRERGATVVVIAHRASMLAHVNKLLVLKDGMADAFGPKEEVLPKLTRAVPTGTGKRVVVPPAPAAAAKANADSIANAEKGTPS